MKNVIKLFIALIAIKGNFWCL